MTHRAVPVPRPALLDEVRATGSSVIEASAGTGKTFALEHLVADAVLRGTRIEHILVITFTEKAAAELELRIRRILDRLRIAWVAPPEPLPAGTPTWTLTRDAVRRLDEARLALGRAPISTIHGFGHRVLRELAFACGAPFERELRSEDAVFEAAFAAVIRRRVVDDPELGAWLSRWAEQRSMQALESMARTVWARRATPAPPFDPRAFASSLRRVHELPSRRLIHAIRTAGVPPATKSALRTRVNELHRIARRFADDGDIAVALDDLAGPERWTYLVAKLDPAWPDAPAWRDAVESLGAHAVPVDAATLQVVMPHLDREVGRVRRERGWMTFSDMIDDLGQALSGERGDALTTELRGRWRVALVDEFQDTDPSQWQILDRIFGQSPEHRLILVGDPKQAIYGFRGADVQTYLDATRAEIDRGAARVRLARCYRSTPALVGALNQLMEPQTDGPSFFSGPVHLEAPLIPGRPERRGLVDGERELAPVHLLVWPKDEPLQPRAAARRTLARGIAAHLEALLARDPIAGDRPLRGGDLFVLTRTGREARIVASALRRRGIRAHRLERRGWTDGAEADDLRAVLRALERPSDPGRALAAFETPFFGVDPAELDRCRELPPGHPLTVRLFRAAELAEARRWAELWALLVDDGAVFARAATDPELASRWPMYEAVLDACLVRAERTRASPGELARWLADGAESEAAAPEIDAAAGHPDAVRVSTIHGAKGLEAEVVVVFGALFEREGQLTPYRTGDGWRVHVGPEPPEIARRQQREEEERLLYVAVTRARRQLILPHFEEQPELDGPYAHLDAVLARCRGTGGFAESPLDWRSPRTASAPGPSPGAHAPSPPAGDLPGPDPELATIAASRAGDRLTSYTALKRKLTPGTEGLELDDRVPVDRGDAVPPGGPQVGKCLHALLETVDLAQVADGAEVERLAAEPSWMARALRRFDLPDAWAPSLAELVVRTLTRPEPLGAEGPARLADADRLAREVDFTFTVPSLGGRLVAVRGVLDAVVKRGRCVWIVDYKSDILPDYEPETLREHVRRHYALQADLYGYAARAWLERAAPSLELWGVAFLFTRAPLDAPGGGVTTARLDELALEDVATQLKSEAEP